MLGERLGAYEIREEIGKGGMAVVYRAYQANIDRDVALKVITRSLAGDREAIQRFQREARLIARLEHAHILPIYDFDGGHEPAYIVMRYLDSGTLKDVLSQGLLPLGEAGYLMRQVSSALDYGHRQGVIHRDVKPSNILIDREGNAFVTDFGIARMVAGEEVGPQLTSSGAIMGTPDYMPPEQVMGAGGVDYRADIYSLGVVLYQMLTGRLPFVADSAMGVMMKQVQEPAPSAVEMNPDLPPAVDEVFGRALAKKPEERYDSAIALAEAISEALGTPVTGRPVRLAEAAGESIILRRLEPQGGSADSTGSSAPSEQNKNVTALYASAAEYGEIVEEFGGGEAARRALAELWQAAGSVVTGNGGQIAWNSDDTLLALWGAEMAREDDAERAIRAALALQETVGSLGGGHLANAAGNGDAAPLSLDIGLNTGLALVAETGEQGTYSASGATISLANRLMQQADGAIVVGHDTYSQVRGVFTTEAAGELRMRRSRQPVPIYRIVSAKPRAFRLNARGVEGVETQMVGRETELKLLQNAFLDALEEEETQVVTVVSDAGLGKSRLLYEFANWSELRRETFWILRGRATPEMGNRPYALLRDLLHFRFEIRDSDSQAQVRSKLEDGIAGQIGPQPEMAHLLGHLAGFDLADAPAVQGLLNDPEQLNRQGRLMFAHWLVALCAANPAVIELEDIHHADDASLDLLNDLITEHSHLPLLLVCLTRPSLFKRRPTWGSGQRFHSRVELRPLDRRDSRRLVREILQKVAEVPQSLRDLLVERSEGNPFYLEELVKTLVDDRVIVKDSDVAWRVEAGRLNLLDVPPTLVGLLQARLDNLLYPDRLTLQRAAAVGRIFYDSALVALDAADEARVEDLGLVLQRLVSQEFIFQRETTAFAGSTEFIFGSAMLRDVVLNTLLRRQQQAYYVAAADWLIGASGERADEYVSLIAEYFEKGGATGQAAAYWQRAGEQALRVSAMIEAETHFSRALDLTAQDDPGRARLQLQLGEVYTQRSEYGAAREALADALARARIQEETSIAAESLLWLGNAAIWQGEYDEAEAYLREGLALAQDSGDEATVMRLTYGLGDFYWNVGQMDEARFHIERSLAQAQELSDAIQEMNALKRLATIEDHSGNTEPALELLNELMALAQQTGNREILAAAANNTGEAYKEQGDLDTARRYYEQASKVSQDAGILRMSTIPTSNLAEINIMAGELAAAGPPLKEALVATSRQGVVQGVLHNVMLAGWLHLKTGDQARGLALLGLVLTHLGTSASTVTDVQRALADAALDPSEPDVAAGLAAGESLDLDEVTAELLAELEERAG